MYINGFIIVVKNKSRNVATNIAGCMCATVKNEKLN
jgi:hypothetical protein